MVSRRFLLMFSACIHLHRKFALPQVDFDLSVCGIKPLYTLIPPSHPSLYDSPDTEMTTETAAPNQQPNSALIHSISKIISCSKLLFSLLRTTHQTTIQRSIEVPPPPNTINLGKAVIPTITKTEDILRQSPFCGCSQVVAGFGAALAVATAGNRWQAMAAQSDFELARATLGRVKRLWAVAGCVTTHMKLPLLTKSSIDYMKGRLIRAMTRSRWYFSYGRHESASRQFAGRICPRKLASSSFFLLGNDLYGVYVQ